MSDYESWLEFTEECRRINNAKCRCGKLAQKHTIFGDLCNEHYKAIASLGSGSQVTVKPSSPNFKTWMKQATVELIGCHNYDNHGIFDKSLIMVRWHNNERGHATSNQTVTKHTIDDLIIIKE